MSAIATPPESPWRVPFDGSFDIAKAPTLPDDVPKKKEAKKMLEEQVEQLYDQQRRLYAEDCHSVLLVFQAMDAAGKDSTIRAVMTGVNPAGCQVYSFKKPSHLGLDHDFLWRTAKRLPERGRIGIFNRSYYEEVLVVRVHPGILQRQKLPDFPAEPTAEQLEALFAQRYRAIRDHEHHLASNGTLILKFFLNVSRDEQKRRFLSRIDDPAKNWKFSHGDLAERKLWPKYMEAYERALNETSRPWAPWFAIPADDKRTMRATVAKIVVDALKGLDLAYPDLPPDEKARLADARQQLVDED
jgi:PPK2 family polyphosphate:nucleotide phosphotransferase